MGAGFNVHLPGFGQHVGSNPDGGMVISSGDRIIFSMEDHEGKMVGCAISPEEAEQLAGLLVGLALKARKQARANKKSMEGTN